MRSARSVPLPRPTTVYAPGYLTGGGSATAVVGTWNAVTDGEFAITIDGVAYDVTALDFSGAGVTDMAAVAAVIQVGIRAATSGSEVVYWDTDHFVIFSGSTSSTSAVTVASAVSGGTGTDISGAGGTAFMDSDTGNGTVTAASQGYQQLTDSYATLGEPFSIAGVEKFSVKNRYKPLATGEILYTIVQVSDDNIDVAEASSAWHTIGTQDDAGGSPSVLTEEPYEYQYTAVSADTSTEKCIVPLRYEDVAQKARIRVKCSKYAGRAKTSVGVVQYC